MMKWFNKYAPGFMFVGHKPNISGERKKNMMWIDVNTLEVIGCGSQGPTQEVQSKMNIKVWKGSGVDTYNV